MSKSYLHILVVVFLFLSMTLGYTLLEGWYSFGIFSLLTFFFSIIYLNRNYPDEKVQLVKLFLIFYSVYSLYTYLTNFLYVDDPRTDFFMMVDSKKFWIFSDYKISDFSEVIDIQRDSLVATSRYILFNFINLIFSFLAQITDENNILLQKLQSIWLGSFSIPFIYLSLRKYFDKDRSFYYSLLFGLLSHVFIYSTVFNRDPHVYFLYTVGAYFVIHYETKKNVLFKLFLIFLFVAGFRLESGLFFLIFFVAFLYLKSQRNKSLLAILVFVVPVGIAILSPIILSKFLDRSEVYEQQLERTERSESSAGASFAKLPPGPRHVLMAVNSQIAPAVPFWRDWFPDVESKAYQKNPSDGYFTPLRFPENIASLFMLAMWGMILGGVYFKKFKVLPRELKLLFWISILFLLAASASINPRRTYCVYPIIFYIAMYLYNCMTRRQRNLVKQFTIVFVLLIYFGYGVFKGF